MATGPGVQTPVASSNSQALPHSPQLSGSLSESTHPSSQASKPGGQAMILEFSQVNKGLKPLYDLYSFKVLPMMGKLVAKDADSYRYLAESIRMHPDQETLLGMMEAAGFERCRYQNLAGGIVALHIGYRI